MAATNTQSRPQPHRRLRLAGQGAALLVLFFAIRAYTQRGIATGAAPPLSAPDLDGRMVSLAAYGSKPVVVHFWATWCPVCNAESGTIDALARDHAVVTIATSSGDAEELRAAMQKRGVSFPVVVDQDGLLARSWGVNAFPTSFFVGPNGAIRFAETGFTTSLGFRARLWLAGL